MNRPRRFWASMMALLTLACLSMIIFEFNGPMRGHPLMTYIKTSFCGEDGLVKPLYVEGQRIGALFIDSSLQEDYTITVIVERRDPVSMETRKVFNISFHTSKNNSMTSSTSRPTISPNPLDTSSPVPPRASSLVLTSPVTTTTRNPHTTYYMCSSPLGRLGNQMFIFASSFGLAAQRNMSLVLQKDSQLWKLFSVTTNSLVNVTAEGKCTNNVITLNSGACCKYNSHLLEQISGTRDVTLTGHLQSYRYFENVERELRKALVVTPEYQNKSSQALLKALQTRYNSSSEWQGRTFVGVHVRRGDFLSSGAAKSGYVAAEEDYYERAIEYFDSHFPNVTFVICSDTLDWARANVRHNHSVVVESGSELVDFAVLTRMNHTLMSTGSFSWWAAWLANGTAVYLKEFLKKGTPLATEFNPKGEDYVLPQWIPL